MQFLPDDIQNIYEKEAHCIRCGYTLKQHTSSLELCPEVIEDNME